MHAETVIGDRLKVFTTGTVPDCRDRKLAILQTQELGRVCHNEAMRLCGHEETFNPRERQSDVFSLACAASPAMIELIPRIDDPAVNAVTPKGDVHFLQEPIDIAFRRYGING